MNENMPREKIKSSGVSKLCDSELISVVLGSGVRGKSVFLVANELAEYLVGLRTMPSLEDLQRIGGVGEVKACQILACLEFSNRFLLKGQTKVVGSPEDLIPYLAFLKQKQQEHMVCLCLDGGNHVLGVHTLTVGLVNQTQIHSREAFQQAIRQGAVSVIFAHNHPSGSLKASPQDVDTTRKLINAGALLDIPVLDHLILSREGFASMKSSHPHLFATV